MFLKGWEILGEATKGKVAPDGLHNIPVASLAVSHKTLGVNALLSGEIGELINHIVLCLRD